MYDYIDAKILAKAHDCKELIEKKTYVEMGRILKAMHVPKAKGYGRVIDGKAEYATFKEWLRSPELEKKIKYVEENKLLEKKHGSLPGGLEILAVFIEKEDASSYCHDDFHTYNIFDTQPLTVFDPNPRFNHGYTDLARTIFGTIWHGEPDETRLQLIEGYFESKAYNTEALWAGVLLYSYMKLPYSHKTNKIENIKNVQRFLFQKKL